MNANIKKSNSFGSRPMANIIMILVITQLITLIDAQQNPTSDTDNSKVEDTKRAGFLPSRGRRFWSIFDWSDFDDDKRAGFMPMRGRKAGFLPMRGKKTMDNYQNDDYLYADTNPVLDNDLYSPKSSSYMPLKDKKAFYAMRGKKAFNIDGPELIDNNKRANFFGSRGR